MLHDGIGRTRHQTALVARSHRRDLPTPARLSGIVLLLAHVGAARAGLILCGLMPCSKGAATGIANRLVAAIRANTAPRTVAHLMPSLPMVGTGDTTIMVPGLRWLSGIFTPVSTAFAATPICATSIMVP